MRQYSDIENIRIAKLERLKAAGLEAYPTRAQRTHTTVQALTQYAAAAGEDTHTPFGDYTLAGRIRAIRVMGKSVFAHIEDGDGRIQIYLKINDVGAEAFQLFVDAFDLGDFIQATGGLFTTKAGEVTLWVRSFRMLAKAISPLPAAKEEIVDGEKRVYSAFDNPEARYRERYADLAVNPEVREIFRTRAQIVAPIRELSR